MRGPAAQDDLKQAAAKAGFTNVEFLEEPIAAGIAFLKDKSGTEFGDEILVFDWGGGTLDIALIELDNGKWNVNSNLLDGDPQLGGEDIDDQLINAVNASLVAKDLHPITRNNLTDYSLLYRRVVEMKRLLSKKEKHSFSHKTKDYDFEFHCSRPQFEDYISDDLDKAFQCLAAWQDRANSAGKSIDKVLLVGGSCQIPAVERRITGAGKRPLKWTNSLQAVALGAAIHAHEKAEREAREKAQRVAREKAEREAREKAEQEARENAYSIFLHAQSIGSTITEEQFSSVIRSRSDFGISKHEATIIEMQIFGRPLERLLQQPRGQKAEQAIGKEEPKKTGTLSETVQVWLFIFGCGTVIYIIGAILKYLGELWFRYQNPWLY